MSTKLFHDFTDVCAEEVCGSEDTVSANGDELLETEFNPPVTRSRASSQEESGEELGRPPSTRSRADSGALLDMLAEVASQKLLFSPMKRKSGYDLRKSDNESSLTMSQVKSLSTNQLIRLFSTTEFNEIKKLYSFHCAFDQNCGAKFISFGNENRAKEKFKKHLFLHLETLKDNQILAKSTKKRKKSLGSRRKPVDGVKVDGELSEDEEKSMKGPKLHWDETFMITDLNMMPTSDSKVGSESRFCCVPTTKALMIVM